MTFVTVTAAATPTRLQAVERKPIGAAERQKGNAEMREAAYYRERALRFRQLAVGADDRTAVALTHLAAEYEAEERRLAKAAPPPVPW